MMKKKNRSTKKKLLLTRRQVLKGGLVAGAGLMLPLRFKLPSAMAQLPGGSLDPGNIPKYVTPLVVPPLMPRSGRVVTRGGKSIDFYEIAVRQFQQHILPQQLLLPPTTVWSYGSVRSPGTAAQGGSFNYPAFTIEAKWGEPVRIKWINDLKDPITGNYLPHILPVDPTLHWANPPGGIDGRDMRPTFDATPGPYTGPVPIVTHLHGASGVGDESDGYAEAWYLPTANDIPAGYATQGTWYNYFREKARSKFGVNWEPGTAVFQYPNEQRASTLWYHDHTLGMTRLNVYAGPAGFYLLRGGPDDQVLDTATGRKAVLPGGPPHSGSASPLRDYEIPIVVQDRSFNDDGSLFYPDTRAFFDGIEGPYIPDTDISPIWNPEFFGNTMVVNGRTWPYLEVEQRRYRFRFLNGCNSRFLVLQFENGLNFWQIGSEGGFLPAPVELPFLLMGPAERADVIVDFTSVPVGTTITLLNLGPDAPFGNLPIPNGELADPNTTGQVMQFRVVRSRGTDLSTPPHRLILPPITPLEGGTPRPLALLEHMSEFFEDAPAATLLGTFNPNTGIATEKMWDDPISENPALGATEIWEFYNFTADAHPMHIHEVFFQVVDRQPFDPSTGTITGPALPPEPWETGFKDTVIAYPEHVTRVRVRFGTEGLFVWHCHIVEHEDNEMMRPYAIGPIPTPT